LHVRIVPHIEDPSRCLIFDVVDREVKAGETIRLGRFSERPPLAVDQMSFKTKVVSRSHGEIWVHDDGKLYLRDMGSSSGTFLNHVRLCPANQASRPVQIKHGDIVQLGVDYQGGREEVYRAVRMRFELALEHRPRPLSFSLSQFSNLQALSRVTTNTRSSSCIGDDAEVVDLEECCICLYALAPFQALFVAPCSHAFHFACIRTLLQSYPGFQCPICRAYSNLESCISMEPDEILAKYGLR
ncbi:SMAD/FHA domain-containing protein, partial [Dichotomocladium elegans]